MSNTPFPPPKKALFVALSGIGNLLMQAPAVERFKQAFTQCHTTLWVAPRGTPALTEALPFVDEIIEAPIQADIARHARTITQLRREHFDIAFMLSPGQRWKGATALRLAGIPRRLGHTYPLGRNQASSWLLNDTVPEEPGLHDVDQNLRLLELLGLTVPPPGAAQYTFAPPLAAQKNAQHLLAQWQLTAARPLIAMHPGSASNFTWKRWPLDNFATVARSLIEKNKAHILVMGGPNEADLKANLCAAIGRAATVVDTDLLTAAALLQHCQLMISNDSGLMHLAASVGTPTLGLFGPTDEHLTGPRGPRTFALRAPGTNPVYNTESNPSLGVETHPTLQALVPAQVTNEVQRILHELA